MERRSFILGTAAATGALALSACGTVSTVGTTTGNRPAPRRQKTDADADAALTRLFTTTPGSREIVGKARGALIFPSVIAAGLGIGGQYGEGALRVGNLTEDYFSLASLSIGLQIGAQSKTIIFLFMTQDALDKFRRSQGWSVGADASVAVLHTGANGAIDINAVTAPVVAFILTNTGLMVNLNLEGTKVTRLKS
jgi:lipid-binding SYLF domain-containing protein